MPSRKSAVGAREIQTRQGAVESQFWGSPKALEGLRQTAGTEGFGEGAEVHGKPGFVPTTWYMLLILTATLPSQSPVIPTLRMRKPRLGELPES